MSGATAGWQAKRFRGRMARAWPLAGAQISGLVTVTSLSGAHRQLPQQLPHGSTLTDGYLAWAPVIHQ